MGRLIARDGAIRGLGRAIGERESETWVVARLPAAERCRTLRAEKKTEEAHLACAEALKYGDRAETLVTQANLFLAQEQNVQALASLIEHCAQIHKISMRCNCAMGC